MIKIFGKVESSTIFCHQMDSVEMQKRVNKPTINMAIDWIIEIGEFFWIRNLQRTKYHVSTKIKLIMSVLSSIDSDMYGLKTKFK